ncbi:hypothetical protein IAT38_003624 [Cryptococcus sp. DSM 104549]
MTVQTKSRTGLRVRYALFITSFILFVVILLLNIFWGGSIIGLILHAVGGLLMLVYAPAAMILSLRDSWSSFDHAGGEVAYLVIQMAIWLTSGVILTCESIMRYCNFGNGWWPCARYKAPVAALSYVLFALFTAWMAWLVTRVHTNGQLSPTAAFRLPTHKLLVGSYQRPARMMDLNEAGESRERVEPYVLASEPQAPPQQPPAPAAVPPPRSESPPPPAYAATSPTLPPVPAFLEPSPKKW